MCFREREFFRFRFVGWFGSSKQYIINLFCFSLSLFLVWAQISIRFASPLYLYKYVYIYKAFYYFFSIYRHNPYFSYFSFPQQNIQPNQLILNIYRVIFSSFLCYLLLRFLSVYSR